MQDTRQEIRGLVSLLGQYRFGRMNEKALQAGIQEALTASGVRSVREFLLGDAGIVDHYLPELRIGIEVKVAGGPSEVLRQIARYCERTEIDGLLLVSTKLRLAWVPSTLAGKPVEAMGLWWLGL